MNDEQIEKEIQAKGLTAPRITPQRIEEVIADEFYFTADEGVIGERWRRMEDDAVGDYGIPMTLGLLTFCVIVLNNGFTVTGESACVSPANFDAELGRNIARQKAVEKIWMLEGYLLRENLSQGEHRGSPESRASGAPAEWRTTNLEQYP